MTSTTSCERDAQPAATSAWTGRAQIALLAVTALATVVRLFRLEQWSLAGAEATTWRAITMPLEGPDGFFATETSLAPIVPLLLRWLVEQVFPGTGEGWLRLPFAFAGALAVPLLGLLGARLLGVGAGLLAATGLALHPLHVAASQTAAPLVAGLTVVLLAANVAFVSRWAAGALALTALGCAPSVWPLGGVLLLGLAVRLPAASRRWLAPAFAVLAVATWCVGVRALGWPLVVAGATGLLLVPAAVAAAVSVATVLLLAGGLARGSLAGGDLLVVLPGVLLLAARALVAAAAARAHLPGPDRLRAVASALPALLLGIWLAVEVTLYATVWQGMRAPWREASRTVLATLGGNGLAVAANAGTLSLRFYLRPAHYIGAVIDPHPGIDVVKMAGDDATFAAWLSAQLARECWLVLRTDEAAALSRVPELASRVRREFTLCTVLPGTRPGGDASLLVYRHEPAR